MKNPLKTILHRKYKSPEYIIPNGLEFPDGQIYPFKNCDIDVKERQERNNQNDNEGGLDSIEDSYGSKKRPIRIRRDAIENHFFSTKPLKRKSTKVHCYWYYNQVRWGHSVYEASCEDERHLALKIIDCNNICYCEELWRYALLKAYKWAKLNHPSIVRLIGRPFIDDDFLYLPMEFVDGITLEEYVKNAVNNGVKFTLNEVLYIIGQILDAVEYLHNNGIIHHDINPSNILICPNSRISVIGISLIKDYLLSSNKFMNKERLSIYGLNLYSSPEQIACKNGAPDISIDCRTDIYSLGRLLYFIITGDDYILTTEQIESKNATDKTKQVSIIGPDIDPEIENVILRATSNNVSDRYGSIQEFKQVLSVIVNRLQNTGNNSLFLNKSVKKFGSEDNKIPSTYLGQCNTDEIAGYIFNDNMVMGGHAHEAYYKGKSIALKIIDFQWYTSYYNDFWTFAKQRADQWANLDHPGIVHIIRKPFFDNFNNLYLPMERVEAISLAVYVKRILRSGHYVRKMLAISIMTQLLDVIVYLHENNVTHYKINPSNILVYPDGKVIVVNIGLIIGQNPRLKINNFDYPVPTINILDNYSSPEQILSVLRFHEVIIDYHTDIFSLGCVMYYILTGEDAYIEESYYDRYTVLKAKYPLISKLLKRFFNKHEKYYITMANKEFPRPSLKNPGVDPALERIVMKATKWRVEDRYNSAQEFKEALMRL